MNFRDYCSLIFSCCISFLIAFVLLISHYYFHELGHIILGFLSNIIFGQIPHGLHLTGWNHLWFLPYPTTTKFDSIINTPLFAFGGPIFTCIWGMLISIILYKLNKFKRRFKIFVNIIILLILLIYFMEAIIGNILFGSDNWTNKPILNWDNCPVFSLIYSYLGLFLLMLMTIAFGIILFPYIKRVVAKFNFT